MAYVIGIDTGGTYTDAVLLDSSKHGADSVVRKAKAFTTHDKLENGIKESISKLLLTDTEVRQIERVVLSTTLATNAIIEGNIYKVGLILLNEKPDVKLATEHVRTVNGAMNIKGRVLVNVNRKQVERAAGELLMCTDAIAVSGVASVRNPVLEQQVKRMIMAKYDVPVICGHELVSDLGFWERTNTAIINAGLLPIIERFTRAIKNVLNVFDINAPTFLVRGDGSVAKLDAMKNKPIDTVLSGPASSMIGTINLTGIDNAIVSDMGGTTTDTGIVINKRVSLSPDGATIGDWKIRIRSAKLHTFGLGGDSEITAENGVIRIGPKRVLPACRGGRNVMTPTDLLHYTGEFTEWDRERSAAVIKEYAIKRGISADTFVNDTLSAVSKKIYDENISLHRELGFPVCAIGAPAEAWYKKTQEEYDFDLLIPENFEVANAVGAATAGIYETVEALVRKGEEGDGFLVHTVIGRFFRTEKYDAVEVAVQKSREEAVRRITAQNLEPGEINTECQDIYSEDTGKYIETRITISVNGNIFTDVR